MQYNTAKFSSAEIPFAVFGEYIQITPLTWVILSTLRI